MGPAGIDYDPQGKYVYWTDLEEKVIRRIRLDGTDNRTIATLDQGKS